MNNSIPLRFRWDHRHGLHRFLVRQINRAAGRVPLRVKYRATSLLRRGRLPYSLVGPGDTVVQVGAPFDTLMAGRSRGMHLALRSVGGSTVIVEPDPSSASQFEVAANGLGLTHVSVVNSGAWYEASTLSLLVDPSHPATNFIDGLVDYDSSRRNDFRMVEVPVDTLDAIVERAVGSLTGVRLVSITTNGAEPEILRGVQGLVDAGLQYLCLARTGEGYEELVKDLGFEYLSSDDRGFTYVRRR